MRIAGLVCCFLSMSAFGQSQKLDAKPTLSRNDFYAACQRLRSAADSLLLLPAESGHKPDRGDQPVTRDEVFQVMGEMFDHFKPNFRSVPRPGRLTRDAIDQRNPSSSRPLIEKLVLWGFVAPEGPLVVGPGNTLTPRQAGDALGWFFNQVILLSHRAIPKWTPRLEPLDGG